MLKFGSIFVILALTACSGSTVAEQPSGRAVDSPATGPWAGTPVPRATSAPAAPVAPAASAGIARSTPAPPAKTNTSPVQIVYVSSQNATIKQTADRTSADVAKPTIGEQLNVSEFDGVRYKVRTTSGVVGYISKLNVSNVPPRSDAKGGGLPLILAGNTRPNEQNSNTPIRGFSETARNAAKESNLPEVAISDTEKMESYGSKITAADIDLFLKQGQVIHQ